MSVRFNSTLSLICVVFAAILIATPKESAAGAWVPKPGSGYNKLAVNYFESRDFFGASSTVERFTNTNISYYGEYGLVDRLGLFGSIALTRLTQDAAGTRTDFLGVGDVDLGLRYALVEEPFVLSASVLFKAPYLYKEDTSLPPGNGQEDLEFRLLFGKGLNRWGYLGIETAYRVRFREPSDEIRYLVEYGVSLTDNIYVRTKLDIIQSVRNGDAIPQGVGNPSLNPEFDLGRVELTTGWNFDRKPRATGGWGAEVTYTHDIFGRNTLQGDAVQLGITYAY